MCYGAGSRDHAVNICPMCKVFPHQRCPHVRVLCRNRTLHPRFDVSYITNAEVDWFNGCGYCKFARTDPPAKLSGFANPGWPGCCRPPMQHEFANIPAYVWRSVNIVHHVPIPQEIKSLLDMSRGSSTPTGTLRGSRKPLSSPSERKTGGGASPTTKAMTINFTASGKTRQGSSPQQQQVLSPSRNTNASAPSSLPTASSMEQHFTQRRPVVLDSGDKRTEGSHSSHSSPSRKLLDLDASTLPRRSASTRRIPVTSIPISNAAAATSTSTAAIAPTTAILVANTDIRPSMSARRNTITSAQSSQRPSPSSARTAERPPSLIIPRTPKKDDELSSASSSSGSSDGTGSMTDSTVTSDGAFTDYLSDESDAELQRQAEARAALLAQTQAEEMEFKAARQQLAHIDLRPPKSWIPGQGERGGGKGGVNSGIVVGQVGDKV
ncbi:hypothetical protein AMATHDRAFT_59170 [Amanita thiersii Skay4041]|uniref:Uncharacterized protein n=1 Tax=Amanita thiersii Skay4041 TaxID=703135 RepID=A0A2A9NSZ7_9AGAR|nr:hypothetical protein AMATHDRAFT_59170 [Amanita thiersii Skay4041]